MTKLEKLIAQLCPDGVEYKVLPDVAEIKRGVRLVKKQLKDNGNYPVYQNSSVPLGYYDEYNCEANKAMIITAGAAGDIIFSEEKFWAADDCFYFLCSEQINDKFLYYVLMSQQKDIYSKVRKASIPRLPRIVVEKIKLPVPPLEVQREIVRILDNFTFLTAELTAELTARQKQYEYYRDLLLTFNDVHEGGTNANVRWMKLGDIGPVCMCKRILKSETNNISGIPFYKIGTFGKQADAFISKEKFQEYKAKYKFPKNGDILISAAGTIGRTVVYDGKPAYFQDSNIVWIDNDETKVLNSFLNYWYSTSPWIASTGGTISRLYNDNITKAPIPVPPLAEQQRIVSVLDRFDKLCNDITSGLPAEIAMRQKQYEYYRNKLLTFKEL